MTHLVLDDDLLDAQVLRAAGSALYGGADLGECLAAARAVRGTDLDSWYDAWTTTAAAVSALARQHDVAGRRETARLAHLRACTYYRTAGVMLMRAPIDPRLVESNRLQTEQFRRAAKLMNTRCEVIEIPFERTTLPGYFMRAVDDNRARATVILTGGYDGTVEELYFWNGAAALARGYNVLAFDGPGQGAALIQQGLSMRADWETVVGAVLDFALARPDVDPDRIALIGLSLGAHLAPRAASAEHRLAAVIADCGAFDLQAGFVARLPGRLGERAASGRRLARLVLRPALSRVMRKSTTGWALRRGLLVHGVRTPLEYLDALKDFTLAGRAAQIRCPVWVCNAENDDISASAPQLVAALTAPKTFVTFTAGQGADDHCEGGARALYHAESFGWLDALLNPQRVGR